MKKNNNKEEIKKDVKIIANRIDEKRKKELIINILKVRNDLEFANRSFEFAEDELIDYYIYQIMANKSKLDYLIKKAKKYGIKNVI